MTRIHYKQISRNGVRRDAHVVLWEDAHGPVPEGFMVDHRNGDKHDNRIDNLRLATKKQNAHNSRRSSNNTTGLKGLSWNITRDEWRGNVTLSGKHFYKAGKDKFEVCCWIISTRRRLHGEFSRIN
jgi:hypothetical protein